MPWWSSPRCIMAALGMLHLVSASPISHELTGTHRTNMLALLVLERSLPRWVPGGSGLVGCA